MAVQIENAPVREPAREGTGAIAANSDMPIDWTEGSPSYWDTLQASLAKLTEAEKEIIHLSLQEE